MLNAPEATASGAAKSLAKPSIWKEDVLSLPVLADLSQFADIPQAK